MTFDLTDSLGGDSPDRTDISQLGLAAIDKTVTTADDVGGPLIQGSEHVLQASVLFSIEEDLVRTRHRLTRDQIAQSGIAAFLKDWEATGQQI